MCELSLTRGLRRAEQRCDQRRQKTAEARAEAYREKRSAQPASVFGEFRHAEAYREKRSARPADKPKFTLRADPEFDRERLDPDVRLWWERMHRSIRHQDRYPDDETFASGDLYQYARPTHTYMQSLLLSLRATGDAACSRC